MIIAELGTSSEEIMLVTAVAGTSWTVTRGYDSSTAVAHDLGAKIVHGVSAGEIDNANAHIEASAGVHGLASGAALVGTTSTQTLTNKTLTAPTINGGTWNTPTFSSPEFSGGTLTNTTLVTPTIASFVNATHTHTDDASGGALSSGGSSQFFFPAPASATSSVSLSTSEQDMPNMSITYTAPDSWPSGAKGIVYNVVFYLGSSTTNFGVGFMSDGVRVNSMTTFDMDQFENQSTYTLSWPGALTTTGDSHTAKVRIDSSSGTIGQRAFWLYLI